MIGGSRDNRSKSPTFPTATIGWKRRSILAITCWNRTKQTMWRGFKSRSATRGWSAITPDTFEPNNSFATASILAPPEDHTYSGLSIHASLNDDYYRVTASATGTLSFDVAFQNSQGDVEMEVFNASHTRLGHSDSQSNSEHVSVNAVAGAYYYVRVFGYEGATNPNYTFSIDQPGGGGRSKRRSV